MNLKLKIAAKASTYLRGGGRLARGRDYTAGEHPPQILQYFRIKYITWDYEVAFVTRAMYLVLAIKCVVNLFHSGTQQKFIIFKYSYFNI